MSLKCGRWTNSAYMFFSVRKLRIYTQSTYRSQGRWADQRIFRWIFAANASYAAAGESCLRRANHNNARPDSVNSPIGGSGTVLV